jgi:histidine ammonia-lyase
MAEVTISTTGMTFAELVSIARSDAKVKISADSLAAMQSSRDYVEELAASETPVYGISTGFGALANRHVSQELRTQLQRSLIRSHAAGVGEPIEREVVRALMALRLKTLCSGKTGVRPVVATTIAQFARPIGFDAQSLAGAVWPEFNFGHCQP